MTQAPQTLSQRLAANRMTVSEALACAALVGDAIRRTHDQGCVHGALTPDSVEVNGTGASLLPAKPGDTEAVTPYTAPERLQHQAPDSRTDIFAFGAMLYEMLAGRPAFAAGPPEALAERIASGVPKPIGNADLDRLVANCLAKNQAGRWQRMQQVLMEIKLLTIRARTAEPGSISRQQKLEADVRAELLRHENTISDIERAVVKQSDAMEAAVSDALNAVRAQVGSAQDRLAAVEEGIARAGQAAEQTSATTLQLISEMQAGLAGEIRALRQDVNAHTSAIDSIRGSIAHTDNLIESVVDALETLQSMVLEQLQERDAVTA